MFKLIKQRHSIAQTIILVNDPYDITIKDSEHDRRTTSKFQGGSKMHLLDQTTALQGHKFLMIFF